MGSHRNPQGYVTFLPKPVISPNVAGPLKNIPSLSHEIALCSDYNAPNFLLFFLEGPYD